VQEAWQLAEPGESAAPLSGTGEKPCNLSVFSIVAREAVCLACG